VPSAPTAPIIIACPECDLLQREPPLLPGGGTACRRCGATLRQGGGSPETALALLLAAAILFAIANATPILHIEFHGERNAATLFDAILVLWNRGMPGVAGLVLFTTVLAPGFEILGLILLLAGLRSGRAPWALPALLRLALAARPWNLIEVLLLGVLVAATKLSHLADLAPGIALWSYAALTVLLAAAAASLDPRSLWARLPVRR
jgi:paraquat-inducible protein A